MTKEDWNDIEARLSDQYDMVTLDVDGYRIDIQVEREKGLKFYYAVYVNKKITGEWIFDDNDEALEIRRRFYQVHRKSLLTAEERKSLSRKSKRVISHNIPYVNKNIASHQPYPANGRIRLIFLYTKISVHKPIYLLTFKKIYAIIKTSKGTAISGSPMI